MSDPDEGNLSPGGRESPLEELGAWIGAAGEEDAEILDSESQGDEEEAAAALVAAEVAEAMESLGEEAGAMGDPEDSTSEEDSDSEPADEEENMEQGRNMVVNPNQLPLAGFHIMFLSLVRTMLHRLYHNDHILVRPSGGHGIILPRRQMPGQAAQIRVLPVSEASGEGAAAMLPEGLGIGAVGSGVGVPAPAPEDKAKPEAEVEEASDTVQMSEEAEEEPAQEAEASEETTEEAAQAAESDQEKEELNQNQEELQKDVDPAESRS